MRLHRILALAVGAIALAALPAVAYEFPRRAPGGALPDDPPVPLFGWRLGAAMTFPYTGAASLSYLFPSEGAVTYKAGATWGIVDGRGTIAGNFSDFRLYGGVMYYLASGAVTGPYVETGLDVVRASGSILPISWPVLPHIGFGTNGRLGEKAGWDLNFTATVNGVLSLDAGYIF